MTTSSADAVIDEVFADVLAANARHAAAYHSTSLTGRAGKRLAVLTCMDSRIDPLAMLGLAPGDAKILRNAGARVTDDVLRTLVLATYLLDVNRVMIVAHTECRMAGTTEPALHDAIRESGGPDTRSLAFFTATDQIEALCADVQRARSSPYLPQITVGGFRYDLSTGWLERHC